MPLTTFHLYRTAVSDLSPLAGMPLADLRCGYTQVADFSPLIGCLSLRTLEVSHSKITPEGVAALQKALPNCKIDWDGSAKPITNINDPAFQAWVKATQALPAEKQIEAVSKKFMELNPGFDGKGDGALAPARRRRSRAV